MRKMNQPDTGPEAACANDLHGGARTQTAHIFGMGEGPHAVHPHLESADSQGANQKRQPGLRSPDNEVINEESQPNGSAHVVVRPGNFTTRNQMAEGVQTFAMVPAFLFLTALLTRC